ncbi:NAD(P)-binding protein [Mammaliicoccus sp. Dog046]|uniref:NAD(P)-binding protein n=1 Tax=Mammaliicoccus sp. Dog046 TaxID=3034233 RepID=UPI002B25EF2F|nr:NAD(P)-binding protein [Mammaliicoccus sp. Dog046]WQK85689.1 NAD(P)-binding protein [Mammaliicoccus sp. Dog046]
MAFVPLMIDLTGKQIKVIGGGKIAERRVNALISSGGTIEIISPEITEHLHQLFQENKIKWREKIFEARDLEHADLIVSATNQVAVNKAIKEATPDNALINMVDGAEEGNVVFPGILTRGKLQISVSSHGASPKLVRSILKDLNEQYPGNYGDYVDFLYSCRMKIKKIDIEESEKQALLSTILKKQYFDTHEQNELIEWLEQQPKKE